MAAFALLYPHPLTRCAGYGAFALGSVACGTTYAGKKIKKNSNKAQKKYCYVTPEDPQEDYYECNYSIYECATQSLAEGQAVMAIVNGIALFGIMLIAQKILRIPISNEELKEASGAAQDFAKSQTESLVGNAAG